MANLLPCVEINPESTPNAAVIWLHGLGADGNDFAPIVPELRLPVSLPVRFVFPHAPSIPVTINGGMVMPAWYDILAMDIDRTIDEKQIRASAESIDALIERELNNGIAADRIIVAGFSQGGAVAYECALRQSRKLAGLVTMSTYLATAASVERSTVNQDMPIFVSHGQYDPVVPETLGRQAVAQLQSWGYAVKYEAYPMEHAVCPPQIRAISAFLQDCLQS